MVMEQVLDAKIVAYLKMLHVEEKESILNVMQLFIKSRREPKSISITLYNEEIEAAEKEYNEGAFITHETLKEQIKQW
jgi:hypothetical protein